MNRNNWKQWIPLLGVYFVLREFDTNRENSLILTHHIPSALWHAAWAGIPIAQIIILVSKP